jgi:hypothetical protein
LISDHSYLNVGPKDIGIEQLSAQQLIELANGVSAPSAVNLLSRINVALETEAGDDSAFHGELCRLFFPEEILKARVKPDLGVPLRLVTPRHLRLVIWLLLEHGCYSGGLSADQWGTRQRLGELLFHAPGVLVAQVPRYPDTSPLALLALELSMNNGGYRSSSRALEEFSVKGHILTRLVKDYNLESDFEQRFGFTPVALQTAIVAIWLHFQKQTPEFLSAVDSSTIGFSYMMGQIGVNRAVGDFISRNMAHDLRATRHESNRQVADLSQLVDRPLAIFNGSVACLDLEYLRSRASRVLWNIATKLVGEKVGEFGNDAGKYFEEYCRRLTSAAVEARADRGSWQAPEELIRKTVDDLIVDGETAVVFEYKSYPLSPAALYGTEPRNLADEIDKKFIFGGKKAAGFLQCANHLRRMLNDRRFRLEGVKKIVPCLVTTEDSLSWLFCNRYARNRAAPLFQEFGNRIEPPVILHTEDLGMLVERSSKRSLPSLIQRLSHIDLGDDIHTKNAITRIWPQEVLDRSGQKVEIQRPTDFLDQALEFIQTDDPAPNICPNCGRARFFVRSGGQPHYWCSHCEQGEPTSELEAQEQREYIEAVATRYESQV